ncbi:MAG TPA: fluoride efflux transporter CrcB [Deltaproteobacteria bacterium]|nr:fluoride efflux transporter CrcB [Deltaproteobacteria bacterium]
MKFIFIAVGGGLGALARYGLSGVAYRLWGAGFPWGTLAVNAAGAFAIGFLWSLFEGALISTQMRTFALIGFLGSLTTFSTYTLETMTLVRDGELRLAVANVAVSNALGLALVAAGYILARALTGQR